MFLKPPMVRRFVYQPYFYEEEKEEEGPRIRFRRILSKRRNPPRRRSMIWMLILAAVVIYLIRYLGGVQEQSEKKFQIEDIRIQVEEIQEVED